MHRMLVEEIMQRAVITVHPEQLVVDAAQLMDEFDIRQLPVVDDEECVVGIVTDADVLEVETAESVLSSYDPAADEKWLTVADVMTSEVITITPRSTVGELAQLLLETKVGGLPVVEPDAAHPGRLHLVGIVTEVDIFRKIADARRRDEQNDRKPHLAAHP